MLHPCNDGMKAEFKPQCLKKREFKQPIFCAPSSLLSLSSRRKILALNKTNLTAGKPAPGDIN